MFAEIQKKELQFEERLAREKSFLSDLQRQLEVTAQEGEDQVGAVRRVRKHAGLWTHASNPIEHAKLVWLG